MTNDTHDRDKLRGTPIRTTPDVPYEEIRTVYNVLRNTRLDYLEALRLSTAETINVVRACVASPWDMTPDDLKSAEIIRAARTGTLDAATLARLGEHFEGAAYVETRPVEDRIHDPEV